MRLSPTRETSDPIPIAVDALGVVVVDATMVLETSSNPPSGKCFDYKVLLLMPIDSTTECFNHDMCSHFENSQGGLL